MVVACWAKLAARCRLERRAVPVACCPDSIRAGNRNSAEDKLSLIERQGQVRKALNELHDRKVLVMKYSMDWSAAQIATVMDSSPAAIDMRLSRARRRLAEILVEQGFDYE